MPDSRQALWLCLHFPDLPVNVFTRGLNAQSAPLVILERQKVVYLNHLAAQAGIQPGNSMDTAYTLNACVVGIERDERKEQQAIRQLADWSYQFTPSVSIKDQHSLLLDIHGCLKLFGGFETLREKILSGLRELGYTCSMANARSPLEALLIARAGLGVETMAMVPVACLATDQKIIESLHNMGIKKVGQLLALPRPGLEKRFGSQFADYLKRLTGEKADPQLMITPTVNFHHEINFPSDVTSFQSLIFPMQRLVFEFHDFLTLRQLSVDRFTWIFKHRNHTPLSLTIRLANPTNDPKGFLNLTQLQLEQFAGLPEVDTLILEASEFSAIQIQSHDLFGDSPDRKDRPARNLGPDQWLLNILRARLGPQTCFKLTQADDHRPEKAWKLQPVDARDTPLALCRNKGLPRPSLLLDTPRRLTRAPISINEGPSGRRRDLELLQGPERIDYGWWEEDTPRDYYIARHASGSIYWVFRSLDDGSWYLHGFFA